MPKNLEIQSQRVDNLYEKIANVIDQAHQMIVTTVNTAEVYSNTRLVDILLRMSRMETTEHNMVKLFYLRYRQDLQNAMARVGLWTHWSKRADYTSHTQIPQHRYGN